MGKIDQPSPDRTRHTMRYQSGPGPCGAASPVTRRHTGIFQSVVDSIHDDVSLTPTPHPSPVPTCSPTPRPAQSLFRLQTECEMQPLEVSATIIFQRNAAAVPPPRPGDLPVPAVPFSPDGGDAAVPPPRPGDLPVPVVPISPDGGDVGGQG